MEMWGRWCQFDDDSAFRVRVVGVHRMLTHNRYTGCRFPRNSGSFGPQRAFRDPFASAGSSCRCVRRNRSTGPGGFRFRFDRGLPGHRQGQENHLSHAADRPFAVTRGQAFVKAMRRAPAPSVVQADHGKLVKSEKRGLAPKFRTPKPRRPDSSRHGISVPVPGLPAH